MFLLVCSLERSLTCATSRATVTQEEQLGTKYRAPSGADRSRSEPIGADRSRSEPSGAEGAERAERSRVRSLLKLWPSGAERAERAERGRAEPSGAGRLPIKWFEPRVDSGDLLFF